MMSRCNDFIFKTEYIQNILYFGALRQDKQISNTPDTHYFSIDGELVYENYFSDFGPLNLGCIYKYCKLLSEKLKVYLNKQAIVHYTSPNPRKAANAAFLMGCYGVLYLGLSPKDALKPLTVNGLVTYRPFQDATEGDSIFTISILDCLKAIKIARDLGFFNFKDFNYEEYNRWDKIAGGDLNWIVPGKFLAFIGPVDVDYCVNLYHPPEIYMNYFAENGVKIVIRLNKKLYDGEVFQKVGIAHYDLFFPDGSCPPKHILLKFLHICEEATGAIAVHCKAGLGRTGSLIGSYLIKHYRMTAREAIGWMRICRPGSVIGHQQAWLEGLESWLKKQGIIYRKKNFNDVNHIPMHSYGVYSIAEKTCKKKKPSSKILAGNQSPPPPIQRDKRSGILAPPRPRASRLREAVNKPDKQRESRAETSKDSIQRPYNKGDQRKRSRSTTRRVGDAWERPLPSSAFTSAASTGPAKTNSTLRSKGNDGSTSKKDVINTSGMGKQASANASRYERLNHLCHALTVTPHVAHRVTPIANEKKTTAMYSTVASRTSAPPISRCRLGRSPSPSPPPSASRVPQRTRTTNTPNTITFGSNVSKRSRSRNSSNASLRTALSRLKLYTGASGRGPDGSLGGHSYGAGSQGAARAAPAPVVQRSPRVRSDERSLATQGDMLNSVKNQRRLRKKPAFNDKSKNK